MDEAVHADELSQPAGVQSNVTASVLPPTPAAVPRGRARPAGARGTAATSSLRGSEFIRGVQRGCFRRGCYAYSLYGIDRGQFNYHKLFLKRTMRTIALRLSWEGVLPAR